MKKALIFLVCSCFILSGCSKKNEEKKYVDETLQEHGETILTVAYSNKECVPVRLSFYNDGVYELFNEYETCKPGIKCDASLKFIKSSHGTYSYDVKKIIENARTIPEYTPDNSPIIEIYAGTAFDGEGYYYTINSNDNKEDLDNVLKQINVNLDECAKANYIE